MSNSIEIENRVESFAISQDTSNITAATVVFTALTSLNVTIAWSNELEQNIVGGLNAALSKINGKPNYNVRRVKILEIFPQVKYAR